jgi:hypothetical protein
LSISLIHGGSNVELELVTHILSVKALNGFGSAFWSVLLVDSSGVFIADESVLSNLVLLNDKGFDGSERSE